MTTAVYKIHKVTIEGFRGFTKKQVIDIAGRNIFIFGLNGNGKSSIVEAIRWCLFGRTGKSDIEVRNTFYSETCRVDLELHGEERSPLFLSREWRPGRESASLSIRDHEGNKKKEQDVLPELKKIGPKDGAQVVFSSQQSSNRRSHRSITEFQRVLCFYLGLETIPQLISDLEKTITINSEVQNDISKRLDEALEKLRVNYERINDELTRIKALRPWGKTNVPTTSETSSKLNEYLKEQRRLLNFTDKFQSIQGGLDYVKIRHANALKSDVSERLEALKEECAEIQTCITELEQIENELNSKCSKLDSIRSEIQQKNETLSDWMSEKTVRSIEEAQREIDFEEQKQNAYQNAVVFSKDYVHLYSESNTCPCCGEEISDWITRFKELNTEIENFEKNESAIKQRAATINSLDDLDSSFYELESQILTLKGSLAAKKKEAKNRFSFDDLAELLSQKTRDISNLQTELDDFGSKKASEIKKIDNFKLELSYHEKARELSLASQQLDSGLDDAKSQLRDFSSLLNHLKVIKSQLNTELRSALDRAIPKLESLFTEVYRRLTKQRSYDMVRIYHDPNETGKLELRVASSSFGDETSFAANVLNGQAERALHLVPYFVFSRFQPEIMELDLLLVDDPSESFDTSHVEYLVDEFSIASTHAQLIVASHEKEKFASHILNRFNAGTTCFIEVSEFSPTDGPTLKMAVNE